VVVGLTSDWFVKAAGKVGVTPYKERRRGLMQFLTSSHLAERATIVKIEDRFDPITEEQAITCVVVTKENHGVAIEANRLRVAKGMASMKIRVVEMVLAKDKLPISSSRIRSGECDEHGNPVS
jgi:pantetheine-phosphate adenylyltransferase